MIKRSQTRVTSHEDEAFRLLVDTMSEGAAILLSNGAISFGNLRFCEMLGMSSDRVISSPFHRFLSPEDQPLFNSLLKRSLTGGGNAEFTLLAGNGTTLPARLVVRPLTSSRGFCVVISDLTERRRSEEERSDRAAIVESPQDAIISKSAEGVIRTPLKNATGEVIGASAIGITGQKRAEEVLRRAGAYNRSLVEASLDPLVTISPDGKITDVNSATETITGSTRDELIGTDFCDYFTDPENARAGYQKVFREGLVRDYELEIRHRDGHTTPVLYNASVYRDEAGTIIGVFAAARDITQRKRAEAENARLALIVNATDDAIFSTTPEGIIAAWNPGAEHMLGYKAEEIRGKHFSLLIPEDRRPDLAANTEKLLRGEALLHYEHENQRKDGTRLQVLVTLSPVKDAKGAVTGVSVITRDITERKRREASLRESEERFRATFENAGIGMALVDMEGHPFKSNPVLDQMLGYGEEELRRMAFTEYTHPDDRESDWRLYGELKLGKRERYEIEKRFLKKGGGLLWGLLTVSLVRDSEGRPAYAVGMVQDITERKRSEEALVKEEHLLHTLMDNLPDLVYFKDRESRFTRINLALAQKLNLDRPDQAVGKTDMDFLATEDAEEFQKDDAELLRTGQPIVGKVEKGIWLDGYVTWLSTTKMPLRSPSGDIIGTFGVSRDITERKQTEDALYQSEDNYRSLVSNIPDVIWRMDSKLRFAFISKNIERLSGFSPDEVYQQGTQLYLSSLPPDDVPKVREGFRALLEEGRPFDVEVRMKRKDGQWIWVHDRAHAIYEKNGIRYADGLLSDITERKRAEEEVSYKTALLEAQSETTIDGILVVDLAGHIILANSRLAAMWDIPEEIIRTKDGKNLIAHVLIRIKDPDAFLEKVIYLYAHETEKSWDEIEFKDGRIFDRYSAPIQNSAGILYGRIWYFRDITARKLAERAVSESENRYRTLFENAPLGIYRTTPGGRILAGNPALVRMFGYSSFEELAKRDLNAGGFEPDYPRSQFMASLEEKGEITGLESAWHKQNGEILYIRENARAVRDGSGRILHYEGTAEDVTAHRRMAEEFQKQENFVKTVLDSAQSGIIACDARGVLTLFNRAARQLFGLPSKDILPEDWARFYKLYLADGKTLMKKEEIPLFRALQGEKLSDVEMMVIPEHGEPRVVLTSGQPIVDSGGRRLGAVVAFHDISQRKRAEAEHLRLVTAIEQSPEAVVMTNTAGEIEYVNPAFTRITGYSRDEALGQNPRILKSGEQEPAFYQQLWATILQGKIWEGEVINRRKDGSRYTEQMSIAPVRGDAGEVTHFIATKQDVTARKQLELQLIQAQKMEAVGRLAGGVAHDFNNLLTIINGYAELIADRISSGDRHRGMLEEILAAGNRAASLTRQLLAFSRRQVLEPRILDLNKVLADIEKMLHRLIGEDVEMVATLNPGLGLVKVDPGQVEQVIMNLAVNARDAMPAGGKLLIETYSVEIDEDEARRHSNFIAGKYVVVAVSDTGCGMDAETQAHIFEPFFTTKEKGHGTGLGLATVYGIVKQSGGFIWVYSEPGVGSTFKIYFPRVEETVPSAEPAIIRAKGVKGTETVLVVEDEEGVRSLVRQTLTEYGYTVLEAEGAEQALKVSEGYSKPIHLLLTDVVMPLTGGKELASRLSTLHPETRVLYMSGYTDDAIVRHGILQGDTPFLQKPFAPNVLLKKVRAVLKMKQKPAIEE